MQAGGAEEFVADGVGFGPAALVAGGFADGLGISDIAPVFVGGRCHFAVASNSAMARLVAFRRQAPSRRWRARVGLAAARFMST